MLEHRPTADQVVVDLTLVPAQTTRASTPPETCPDGRHDVAIVGLGYVGLPTALSFASAGERVCGIDVSEARLQAVRDDAVDLLPVDHERLRRALSTGDLTVTRSVEHLRHAGAAIVCVPTPVDAHLVPDLTLLRAACASVVEHAQPGQLLLLTSTTYVGTTRDLLVEPLRARGLEVGTDVFVAFSPERIDPGNAAFPQASVPRVVGGVTEACTERACALLSTYADTVHRVSSPEAAEMTKLYENVFRAVNISLANELASVCSGLGVDITEVIDAASTKPYGFMRFLPGSGVGGHCIPCDPHYLLWQLRRDRRSAPLIEQAMTGIAARPLQVVARVRSLLAEHCRRPAGARVLVVGVAYKPGVEDLRESPALEIVERLRADGVEVQFVDPLVPRLRLADGSVLHSAPRAASEPQDVVVLHTLHPDVDHSWVAQHEVVLDTTYRFAGAPHRVLV